jgi:hypothetical protein
MRKTNPATSDGSRERANDSVDSFICQNLPVLQVRWLVRQSEALQQTRSDLLKGILREWFAATPPGAWAGLDEGEIMRRAVGEFILRHQEEFLPVSCSKQ